MWAFALVLGTALAQDAEHGALLAGLGGCETCHTADGGAPSAGGHAIETDQGIFYGTNLTPDPEHGLGAWSQADFVRAMREGRRPDGKPFSLHFHQNSTLKEPESTPAV